MIKDYQINKMEQLDTYQKYKVGKYVSSYVNMESGDESDHQNIFYFVVGSIIKDYYPDCYNHLLTISPLCQNNS